MRGVGLLLGLALALGAAQGEEETATHQAKVVRFLEVHLYPRRTPNLTVGMGG